MYIQLLCCGEQSRFYKNYPQGEEPMLKSLKKIVNLNLRLIEAAASGVLKDFAPEATTIKERLNYMEDKWKAEAHEAERLCYPVVVTVLLNSRPTKICLNRVNEVTNFGRVVGEQVGNKQVIYFNSWQILAIQKLESETEKKDAKPKEEPRRTAEA